MTIFIGSSGGNVLENNISVEMLAQLEKKLPSYIWGN